MVSASPTHFVITLTEPLFYRGSLSSRVQTRLGLGCLVCPRSTKWPHNEKWSWKWTLSTRAQAWTFPWNVQRTRLIYLRVSCLREIFNIIIKTWCCFARQCCGKVVASQRCLVENGLISAHKTPLVDDFFLLLIWSLDGPTNVKNLTVVWHVCIIPIIASLTTKIFHQWAN